MPFNKFIYLPDVEEKKVEEEGLKDDEEEKKEVSKTEEENGHIACDVRIFIKSHSLCS